MADPAGGAITVDNSLKHTRRGVGSARVFGPVPGGPKTLHRPDRPGGTPMESGPVRTPGTRGSQGSLEMPVAVTGPAMLGVLCLECFLYDGLPFR